MYLGRSAQTSCYLDLLHLTAPDRNPCTCTRARTIRARLQAHDRRPDRLKSAPRQTCWTSGSQGVSCAGSLQRSLLGRRSRVALSSLRHLPRALAHRPSCRLTAQPGSPGGRLSRPKGRPHSRSGGAHYPCLQRQVRVRVRKGPPAGLACLLRLLAGPGKGGLSRASRSLVEATTALGSLRPWTRSTTRASSWFLAGATERPTALSSSCSETRSVGQARTCRRRPSQWTTMTRVAALPGAPRILAGLTAH